MVTTRRSIASGVTFVVAPAASLSIASGNTVTTDDGVFDTFRDVSNAGTYSNQGTVSSAVADVNDASTWSTTGTVQTEGTTQAAASDTTSTDIDTTASTLSRTRSLIATGTDIDATSAVLTRLRALASSATDIDSGITPLTRERFLTTIDDGDPRFVASTDTFTVQSGDTAESLTVENAGTVSNAGTYQSRDEIETADIDSSESSFVRTRALASSATDVDTAPIQLTRLRALTSTATDIDAADSTLLRERSLVATGTDVDTAIARLFVVRFIESTRAVEAVEEVLDAPNGHWRHEEPDVQFYWDSTQSERGNGADQPADVYVWSPTGTTHERFSLDSDKGRTDDTTDVEILVYSLDEFEVMEYAEDIALLLEEYFDDNKDLTNFTTIEPVATRDYREQTNHRATDHYVAGVEVELRTLSPATRRG